MMKSIRVVSLTAVLALALAGCTDMFSSGSSGSDSMMVAGSANMANTTPGTTVAANQSAMTSGSLGGSVGKSMDDMDQVKVNQTLESNKTNQAFNWTNPSTGVAYTVTPTRTFSSPTGEPCRDFTTTAGKGGQVDTVYGTACRDSNGQWHIISS